jgi:hypothetical protein
MEFTDYVLLLSAVNLVSSLAEVYAHAVKMLD